MELLRFCVRKVAVLRRKENLARLEAWPEETPPVLSEKVTPAARAEGFVLRQRKQDENVIGGANKETRPWEYWEFVSHKLQRLASLKNENAVICSTTEEANSSTKCSSSRSTREAVSHIKIPEAMQNRAIISMYRSLFESEDENVCSGVLGVDADERPGSLDLWCSSMKTKLEGENASDYLDEMATKGENSLTPSALTHIGELLPRLYVPRSRDRES